MLITPDTAIANIATAVPATIRVFQRYHIDFCCGGNVSLGLACAAKGLSTDAVLSDLRTATASASADAESNMSDASLTAIVQHVHRRYHIRLRMELPLLDALLAKVVDRHGAHLPDVLPPLQQTFHGLHKDLLASMTTQERLLFPCIEALDAGAQLPMSDPAHCLISPITLMEAAHADAGAALGRMRALTGGYAPPEWACPTFRGLYYGLSQLEADMRVHVHIESNILFPRAVTLASRCRTQPSG